MKEKIKLRILIIGTIIIALAFVVVMALMIKQNSQCVDNPFKYSAIRLNESGGNYACSCKSLDPKLLDFTFNEEGIKIIRSSDYINLSDLKIVEVKGG